MSFFRSSLVAAAFGSALVGAQLVACGGDDEKAANPGPVPGTDELDASAPTGPELTISATRAKLYLGQTAKFDGAALAPNAVTDITWQVVFAPSESKITTADLANATTATPSFKPDVMGAYTLQVSGKKDGQVSSVLVYIEAVDAPVFWREGRATMGENKSSYAASTYVGGVYGANARAVACSAAQTESSGDNGRAVFAVRDHQRAHGRERG